MKMNTVPEDEIDTTSFNDDSNSFNEENDWRIEDPDITYKK